MTDENDNTYYLNRITRWGDTDWARGFAELLLAFLGQFRNSGLPRDIRKVLSGCSYATLPPTALAVVLNKRLTDDPMNDPAVDSFIRDAVTLAAPHTAYAAHLLMARASSYVVWCVRDKGLPLDPELIWGVRTIDKYTTSANQHLSEGTRRNYRALLMRISEVLVPDQHPKRTTPLNKKHAAEPYTPDEMAAFRDWAASQLTAAKRDRAMLMLVLCAGAGIRPSEIPLIHHEHVTVDDDGILITVDSETESRDIPLLSEWEEWMTVLLERRPTDESLWGRVNRRTTHNLTSSFTENTYGRPPRADRLRHTWLTRHLTVGVPMKELFRAAGLGQMSQLSELLEHVEYRDEADYRRILRSEAGA